MRKVWGVSCTVVAAWLLVVAPTRAWGVQTSLTLYGGLFGNKEYVQLWEGISASVGVHERVSLVGRITGLHYLETDRFRDGSSGLGEGGLAFNLAQNASITVLGGSYFGAIEDPVIDGWFSIAFPIADFWLYHNVGAIYGFDSERWQAWGSLSTVLWEPNDDLILFGGVETVFYNEGRFLVDGDFVSNPDDGDVRFQLGPMVELHKRSWDAGIKLGVGGGDYGVYGTASLYKRFTFGS